MSLATPRPYPGLPPASELATPKGRAMRRLFLMLGACPLWLNHAIGSFAGLVLLILPNRHRRVSWFNLKFCFPEHGLLRRLWWLLRSLQEGCKGITELGVFWTRPPERVLGLIREIVGESVLDDALSQQRPILFGAPHLGSWELLNLYLSNRTRCSFLYREPHDTGVETLLTRARERMGARLIRANRQGVKTLLKRFHGGDLIGILPDHQPRRGQGVFAPFFGRPAYTMVLFSRLIQRERPEVVIGFAERLSFGRGYRLHLHAADPAVLDPDLQTSCEGLNAMVERLARQHPLQYEWTYKRFNVQSDGSMHGYGEETDP